MEASDTFAPHFQNCQKSPPYIDGFYDRGRNLGTVFPFNVKDLGN